MRKFKNSVAEVWQRIMNYLFWSSGFIIGNCVLHQLSALPRAEWLLLLSLFCFSVLRKQSFLVGLAMGFVWTWGFAYYYLQQQLPDNMIKQNVEVIGQIVSIPQVYPQHVAFGFRVQTLKFNGKTYFAPKNLRLSWYQDHYSKNPEKIPVLSVGQTWQFTVRLKPPHGFLSPGANDYSQHLFSQHVNAVGHVYTKFPPILLNEKILWRDWINKQRENLWHKLQPWVTTQSPNGIIAALALGERAGISNEEWKILQATGTSHLVAISGLHVGLVAGLVLASLMFFCRYLGVVNERFPVRLYASALALLAAFIYSAMAGFAVPTQRALIMLALVMYGFIQRRSTARVHILITAAVIILIYDPLATLSVSFWLSFIAIAIIFYIMHGRQNTPATEKPPKWREWARLQWGISCLLIPITLWYFQQAPLVSPIANALAIPWVSFVVVPLTLLGCVFLYLWPWLGELLLQGAVYGMQAIWFPLKWLATWPYATWEFSIANIWLYACILMGAMVVFMPRGIPGKLFGICALLPIWFLYPARPVPGEVWVDVLDVGQGLAVVVRTAQHNLVFDTGDLFSDRLNAASAVILPFLRHESIATVDALIVSHNDRDHRGGAETLLEKIPIKTIYAGENWRNNRITTQTCRVGQQWRWDNVDFRILHPDPQRQWEGNNASCVLKISTGAQSILITGDIESQAENYLVKFYPQELPATILIAGHHGSTTSSSKRFLQHVDPAYVVFAAGYLNRFKFPNPKIVARFNERNTVSLITGTHGTIHFEFDAEKMAKPITYIERHRRYWHPY